jgi:Sulfotransferase family
MSGNIQIDDLANPIYTQEQKTAIEYGQSLNIDLSRDSILNQAVDTTGLNDFGAKDFIKRLDLLVDEWNSDNGLTQLGRLSLRNKLQQFANNRLLIEDTLKRNPEILNETIQAPIIVAGLPRSGTTHLLNLMAADQRLRALPLWESYEPILMPHERQGQNTSTPRKDPRYQRCTEQWQVMQQMTPHLAAMHPMNPDHIHEELELMGPDFASYNFEWLSMSPRWRDHYYQTDQTPHYHYLKKVLQILQWQDKQAGKQTSRWILKCPQHMEQLPVLKSVFPDAIVAITHRDPVSVIQSAATMLAYGQRMSRYKVETKTLIKYWSDRIEHLLKSCVEDRAVLNEDQSIDIAFHDFMENDFATVRKVYEIADLEINEHAMKELNQFIINHPRGKHGRIIYNLERDFGVNPSRLQNQFNFYFDKFPIKSEIN